MVKIYGNVKPEDDYTHTLGPEENFNESVYFNFTDRSKNLGGFLRLGNRANEGYAELTVVVFNPDGSVLFNYKRPQISDNDGWNAGGAAVEVVKPGETIVTTYNGSTVSLDDPREMKDPSKAFKQNPHRTLALELTHHGCGPIYGHVGDPAGGNDFARAHYEQHMRVEGTLQIGRDAPLEITGHGVRDHSWGPRYWQSTPSYRWITGSYGDDLGMVLSVSGDRKGGVIHRGDELLRVRELELETDYEPGTRFHSGLRARLELENGETHTLEGRVKGFIPLRNRRSGATTHIGEGMTEYVLDGERVGYGLSEYLDQPED